jgi:hypothetical protein
MVQSGRNGIWARWTEDSAARIRMTRSERGMTMDAIGKGSQIGDCLTEGYRRMPDWKRKEKTGLHHTPANQNIY